MEWPNAGRSGGRRHRGSDLAQVSVSPSSSSMRALAAGPSYEPVPTGPDLPRIHATASVQMRRRQLATGRAREIRERARREPGPARGPRLSKARQTSAGHRRWLSKLGSRSRSDRLPATDLVHQGRWRAASAAVWVRIPAGCAAGPHTGADSGCRVRGRSAVLTSPGRPLQDSRPPSQLRFRSGLFVDLRVDGLIQPPTARRDEAPRSDQMCRGDQTMPPAQARRHDPRS